MGIYYVVCVVKIAEEYGNIPADWPRFGLQWSAMLLDTSKGPATRCDEIFLGF